MTDLINDELPEVVARVIPHLLVIAVITRWVTALFALSLLYSDETTAISGGNRLPVRHSDQPQIGRQKLCCEIR